MPKTQPTNNKIIAKRDIPCNQKSKNDAKKSLPVFIYVYNVGMKKRKAFTVIEAVITLAIMAIALGLTAVAFSNLGNIQTAATDQLVANRELTKIDYLVSRYVSIVSVDSGTHSFYSASIEGTHTLTFTSSISLSYTLSFSNKQISAVQNNPSSDIDTIEVTLVDDVIFDYDSDLGLLISHVSYLSNKKINYSYIVRTAL